VEITILLVNNKCVVLMSIS